MFTFLTCDVQQHHPSILGYSIEDRSITKNIIKFIFSFWSERICRDLQRVYNWHLSRDSDNSCKFFCCPGSKHNPPRKAGVFGTFDAWTESPPPSRRRNGAWKELKGLKLEAYLFHGGIASNLRVKNKLLKFFPDKVRICPINSAKLKGAVLWKVLTWRKWEVERGRIQSSLTKSLPFSVST